MTEHPAAAALEEIAAGGRHAATEDHLRACGACREHVTSLRAEAATFRLGAQPPAFVARVEQTVLAEARRVSSPGARWKATAGVVAVFAVAAALLVFLRRPATPEADVPLAPLSSSRPLPSAPPVGIGSSRAAWRFMGRRELAVIRERDGQQERFTGSVTVRAGDRLRAQISLDHDETLVLAVLEATGALTTLLDATALESGTHYSDAAARFTDPIEPGWVVSGSPEEIARARDARSPLALSAVAIVPESSQDAGP
jgi:hypothetical protein